MIRLTHDTPIVLGVAPADFRAGVDGFAARTRELLGRDPRDGTLYVYINRAGTMIRGLAYEGNGYWLMTKRLSKGRFRGWPTGVESPMSEASARALRALLDGGCWAPGAAATGSARAAAVPAPSPSPSPTRWTSPASWTAPRPTPSRSA